MKQKLKGILSLTALSAAILVLMVYKWKELLVGAGLTVAAILAIVVLVMLVALIGAKVSGDRWDKE